MCQGFQGEVSSRSLSWKGGYPPWTKMLAPVTYSEVSEAKKIAVPSGPMEASSTNPGQWGIACFVLYLVFYFSRMPEAVRRRAPTNSSPIPTYPQTVVPFSQRKQREPP